MIKDVLQGKPLRHPLHPFLVHFPIGLFVLSFLLDLASLIFRDYQGLVAASFYSIVVGVVMALVAAIPGFVDYIDIRNDHPAKKIAIYHMMLNLTVVALYGLNLGLRARNLDSSHTPLLPLLLSLGALVLLSISGYLGGKMVYDLGIAAGRHRRLSATPQETYHLDDQGKSGEQFVAVPQASALKNGETLRLEIRKQVIVLAKVHGEFFAFQEFCTHRFGPLSEGRFTDHEVQCPWHRSCFDVRTGRVVNGPAKEPLKTWPVRVEDGKVMVRIDPRVLEAKPAQEPKPAEKSAPAKK